MDGPSGYQITFSDVLTVGPAQSSDCTFPAGASLIPFATNPNPKFVAVSTGDMQAALNNLTFTALPGVGAGGVVTQGTFLYFRCNAALQVRTTTFNSGGNVVAVEVVNGLKVVEYDPGAYLVLLEVLGQGQVEYLVAGPV
jgi:hypothetical protein